MRWKSHVRCGAGEKLKIISKIYLSLFSCVLFKGIAENTVEYCHKGDLLGIKGRIQTRKIEEEETPKQVMEVIAEKVSFLSSNQRKEENGE